MSIRVKAAFVLAVSLALATVAPAAGAAGGGDAAAERARYWTAERREAAVPRDLVVDRRGNGYLRHQDGTLQPHGASPAPMDSVGPVSTPVDPAAGAVLTASSHTFKAEVVDGDGVKSVAFNVGPSGGAKQTFTATSAGGNIWQASVTGLTDGRWEWTITARDRAKQKGGNTKVSDPSAFSVDTSGSGGGGGGGTEPAVVGNAAWPYGGDVQLAAGRIYFEMPTNSSGTRWGGYVCSGTTADDQSNARSIIITAAHCVYDDASNTFARNVLFIPNQDATTGSGTDTDCSNDPLGCWSPSHGVVDVNWTTREWPANIPWDYAYYVAPDTGWSGAGDRSLDGTVDELPIQFATAPTVGAKTHALGYSHSDDPNFMYCAEGLARESSYGDWWLGQCGLSGGSSGGPWVQPMDVTTGSGPIVSVNSWGYTNEPGMAGPRLSGTSASCVFNGAKANVTNDTRGYKATCPQP